ncbi:hypothetical protein J6590_052589 [Homalodisca vitripennis]|nr:hypothetical protein J6590_098633 [Homalodisca vitripennis]KAG8316378.1 hypothetical protein J6590_052589 [Homalodisca vitripennis]
MTGDEAVGLLCRHSHSRLSDSMMARTYRRRRSFAIKVGPNRNTCTELYNNSRCLLLASCHSLLSNKLLYTGGM